jgi:hypothetical protein
VVGGDVEAGVGGGGCGVVGAAVGAIVGGAGVVVVVVGGGRVVGSVNAAQYLGTEGNGDWTQKPHGAAQSLFCSQLVPQPATQRPSALHVSHGQPQVDDALAAVHAKPHVEAPAGTMQLLPRHCSLVLNIRQSASATQSASMGEPQMPSPEGITTQRRHSSR